MNTTKPPGEKSASSATMWGAAVRIVTLAALAAFAAGILVGRPSERRLILRLLGMCWSPGIDWDFVAKRATDLILFSVEPLPDGDLKPYFPIDDEAPTLHLSGPSRTQCDKRPLASAKREAGFASSYVWVVEVAAKALPQWHLPRRRAPCWCQICCRL